MKYLIFFGVTILMFQATFANPKPEFGLAVAVQGSATVTTSANGATAAVTAVKAAMATFKASTSNDQLAAAGASLQQIVALVNPSITFVIGNITKAVADKTTSPPTLFANLDKLMSETTTSLAGASDIITALTSSLGDTVAMKFSTSLATVTQGVTNAESSLAAIGTGVQAAMTAAGTGVAVTTVLANENVPLTLTQSLVTALTTIKTGLTALALNLVDTVKGVQLADKTYVSANTTSMTSAKSANQTQAAYNASMIAQIKLLTAAATAVNQTIVTSFNNLNTKLNSYSTGVLASNVTAIKSNITTFLDGNTMIFATISANISSTMNGIFNSTEMSLQSQIVLLQSVVNETVSNISSTVASRMANADTCFTKYGNTINAVILSINTKLSDCIKAETPNIVQIVKAAQAYYALLQIHGVASSSGIAYCLTLGGGSASTATPAGKLQVGLCLDAYSSQLAVTSQDMSNQAGVFQALLAQEQTNSANRFNTCLSQRTTEVTIASSDLQDTFANCIKTGK